MSRADDKDDVGSTEPFKIYTKAQGKRHDIYLSDEVASESADYIDLMHFLNDEVSPEDAVNIHLANMGGSVHSGTRLAHAIKRCAATVLITVESPCYSMGAILALTGHALIMRPGTFLMFHNYSGFAVGKGGEAKDALLNTQKHMLASDMYFCYPFLSKAEIAGIHKDQDVYVHAEDKDLIKRLKRHFKRMVIEE